jgi:hypothetical protein
MLQVQVNAHIEQREMQTGGGECPLDTTYF